MNLISYSSSYSQFDSSYSGPEAHFLIGTHINGSAASSIFFTCSRLVPWVNKKIYPVFLNAIQGNAHQDMTQNQSCSHEQVIGGCGNTRGSLSECRCEILDRKRNPTIRRAYEDKVIETMFTILEKSESHLKLAMFCSGELLGEQILLFRLFHELKQKNFEGTIEVFFIDKCYGYPIRTSYWNQSFSQSVGGQKYIEQFLQEIGQCLPQNITLKGNFFADAQTYIDLAKSDRIYRHHLLIGADIENANADMGKISKEAGLTKIAPIALVKTESFVPQICQVDTLGNLKQCYDPRGGGDLSLRLAPQNQQDNTLATMVGIVSCLALATFLIIVTVNHRRSN